MVWKSYALASLPTSRLVVAVVVVVVVEQEEEELCLKTPVLWSVPVSYLHVFTVAFSVVVALLYNISLLSFKNYLLSKLVSDSYHRYIDF